MESVVKGMQRQLLQIADKIPDDIMLTLLKCFAKISSLEPEPAPKIPFIRAFAKRQDSPAISSESEAENECTFSLKLSPSTQEVSLAIGSNENEDDDQTINQSNETDDENAAASETPPEQTEEASSETVENVDEGIDVEIPRVSSDDEATAEEQFAEINEQQIEAEPEEIYEYEESLPEIDDEPIPEEPPKVSLDDIERELQQMQAFLMNKGVVDKDKLRREEEEEELRRQREMAERARQEEELQNQQQKELNDIEDAYKIDVCVKLKNRDWKEHEQRDNKYHRSENYREEVIDEGPIFDPTVPNTIEDFMRAKTYNGNKKKIFDMSWQNLCENQRKVYKWDDEWIFLSDFLHSSFSLIYKGIHSLTSRRHERISSKHKRT